MRHCDAPTERDRACRNPAGWGTEHPGDGRCKLHEGAAPITAGSSAPGHLRPGTRQWFEAVTAEYILEEHHVRLLTLACEAWDRCCEAREAIEKHGLTYIDRFDQPKIRPEAKEERANRIEFARLVRELGLDVEPPDAPRPPRGPNYGVT